jgi:hypothetical protein
MVGLAVDKRRKHSINGYTVQLNVQGAAELAGISCRPFDDLAQERKAAPRL